MDILGQILAAKRRSVEAAIKAISPTGLRQEAAVVRESAQQHALLKALQDKTRLNVIAEFKRRSPSRGLIRGDASVSAIARAYESGGAAAISVLTEEDYFAGSLGDLRAARKAVTLPLLRKDFIFDEYQVYESAAAGADALLLIVAALNDESLVKLRRLAEDMGMDALVEVHARDEMRRALESGAKLIGVNNRDLKTFEVSLQTSAELARDLSTDLLLVSESGLHTRAELQRLRALGFDGFLIGESLMRAERPEEALRNLCKGS